MSTYYKELNRLEAVLATVEESPQPSPESGENLLESRRLLSQCRALLRDIEESPMAQQQQDGEYLVEDPLPGTDYETLDDRTLVLDEWARLKGAPGGRLGAGGDITADTTNIAIRYDDEPVSTQSWEAAFEIYYGLSYDEFREVSVDTMYGLYLVLNHRASALSMGIWQTERNASLREQVVKDADTVIQAWRNKEPDLFRFGSTSQWLAHTIGMKAFTVASGSSS